jgi:predicted  nucleic acid-binding Zn-ribbon protein
MTERFNLAANVLLSRRLKNLLRIDDNVAIDMSYITCAEYQLFIDEKRESGEERQPDHWESYIFPSKDARKPITGVRASDAEAFCEWLTHRYSLPGFRYRLPILSEAEEHRATEKQIGCWCNDGVKKVIVGIEMSQAQAWMEDLADVLACDFKGIEALVHAFVLEDFKNFKDFNILTLARKLDSHSDIHITEALNQAGIYFLPAKMIEQVNIIKNDYFQSFNLLSVLSEFNSCCFNFINHINSESNKIIGAMKVIAEENICEFNNEIEYLGKKIRDTKIDLYKPQEDINKCRNKYSKVIDKSHTNLHEFEALNEKMLYHPIRCRKELDQAINRVNKLNECSNEEKEYSQFKRELYEAENEVKRFRNFYNKAMEEVKPIEAELYELQKQIKKIKNNRDQEIASVEKLICSYRNNIVDSEKRILKLIEARSNYEKQCDIFDDVIRLTTNRSYLLFIIFLLNSFAAQSKTDDVWNSYRCLVLRDARRLGQIPVWEGIRIVKERVQE